MPTAPTPITPLPTAPSRADPANFPARADAFMSALPTFGSQLNANASAAFTNASDSVTAANNAAASQTSAAASATAAAASAVTAANAPGTSGTSTTSLTIGTGSQTLTTQTGKAWVVGQFVTVASTASPTNFMYGQITAYNSGTGSMTVSVLSVGGSGTLASWTIGLGGPNSTLTDQNSLQPVTLTLPSIRPSLLLDFANAKRLDPRITFSRATSGTYYDGVTSAKAEENLFPYGSNIAATNWQFLNNVTWTANAAAAPDGSATASKCASSITGTGVAVSDWGITGAANTTYSVYAKKAEYNYLVLGATDSAGFNCVFDLDAGTVFSTGAGYTAAITPAGNGWYRCVCSAAVSQGNYFAIGTTSNGSISNSMTAGSGIFVWGAQLERRLSVTAYTPTTTQPITNYIPQLLTAPAGVPRFDHNPTTGESLGLLIEEQRTNLLTYSQEFDNAAWDKTRVSVTANASVAPDGTLSADLFVADAANNTHSTYPAAGLTISGTYTWSIYAKAAGSQWFAIDAYTGGGSNLVFFDLQNGVVGQGSGSPTITPVGNGWYRCTVTRATSVGTFFGVYAATANGVTSFAGNGYSGIFIWGAQLEAGAFPTSYIPTTSASVTRTADDARMTGVNFSSWYRQDQGTFFIGFRPLNTTQGGLIGPINAAGANIDQGFYVAASTNQLRVINYLDSGSSDNDIVNNGPVAGFNKIAVAGSITDNTTGASFNAQIGSVNASRAQRYSDVAGYRIGESGGQRMTGNISRLAYYPARLTNAQLQALTA